MRGSVLALALLSVTMLTAGPACASRPEISARFDRPQTGFAPAETVLSDGSPRDTGLDPGPIDGALRQIADWTNAVPGRPHPMYAGEVGLLANNGVVVGRSAAGHAVRYADAQGTELPPQQQVPARRDTIFDIASLTKLFTSVAVLQQVESGAVRLDAPVARYLPEFGVNGKQSITVQQLLTHTSGLQAKVELWKLPPEQRIPSVLALTPQHPPGTHYEYADPNLITAGVLAERVTGQRLDQLVHDRITEPLGMADTGYNPPPDKLGRIAATEFEADPPRGMVRGQVQDENAWSLGGVSGQAGVFSTADDLAVLGQALLNGGTYRGQRVLGDDMVTKMLTNYNGAFPGDAHGLGFELDQRWYMAGLSGPHSAGHTGFSGTSMVLDPASRSVAVLLSNRVHPTREWGSNNPARQAFAQGLADALPVRPTHGSDAWFTPTGSAPTTLSADAGGPVAGDVRIGFDTFVDTQNDPDGSEPLLVESSVDGGATWQPVPVTATGPGAPDGPRTALAGSGHRAWWQVRGTVPAQPGQHVQLRWQHLPGGKYSGRGIYVDGVIAADRDRTLLDGEREPQRFTAQGWHRTDR